MRFRIIRNSEEDLDTYGEPADESINIENDGCAEGYDFEGNESEIDIESSYDSF